MYERVNWCDVGGLEYSLPSRWSIDVFLLVLWVTSMNVKTHFIRDGPYFKVWVIFFSDVYQAIYPGENYLISLPLTVHNLFKP